MKGRRLKAWLPPLEEMPQHQRASSLFIIRWIALITLMGLSSSVLAAQEPRGEPQSQDAQKCSALVALNLEDAPGGPALITSARLVEVPASGLEQWVVIPSGYGKADAQIATRIHQYCDVTGYVAPQNKFALRLPLPGDWNQNFFFAACGGFCGYSDARRCNLALARGYASVPRSTTASRSSTPTWPATPRADKRFCWKRKGSRKTSMG